MASKKKATTGALCFRAPGAATVLILGGFCVDRTSPWSELRYHVEIDPCVSIPLTQSTVMQAHGFVLLSRYLSTEPLKTSEQAQHVGCVHMNCKLYMDMTALQQDSN